MNQSRLWTIGAVVLIFALLAGTWFLGVAPRLSDARDADNSLAQTVTLNNAHRQTLASLQAEHERLDEIRAELEEAHSVIPETPKQDEVLRAIDEMARRTGVVITNLTFQTAAHYVAPDEAPAEFLAAAQELISAGLFVIPVTIELSGSDSALLSFMSALQSSQRYFHVHQGEILNEEESGILTIQAELFGINSTVVESSAGPPTPPAGE